MTTMAEFEGLYQDVVYANLRNDEMRDIAHMPHEYLLALYPDRFNPQMLWQEVKVFVQAVAAGLQPLNPKWRLQVEEAYNDALNDTTSGREYLVTSVISNLVPQLRASFEVVETDYTEFVSDYSYQFFWAKFDEVTSMLLSGLYLLVGYPYLGEEFYVQVEENKALRDGAVAIMKFMQRVFL